MAEKLIYITNDDTQTFCRLQLVVEHLNTQLNEHEQTNKNSIEFPKMLCQRIRKRYYKC